ncbi:MAG: M20/M25/M40 family metallo-hydrolase, partial [Armatimonadota bacterium]|nr:M20/M25/M40 family metallo-hydrolase [Armatimonadota bacterium]
MERAIAYARQRRTEFLEELKEWLAIPSVSTLPEHGPDCERAARWLADRMRRAGLRRVEVVPSQRQHPLVYGEWVGLAGAPTVLVYGHYDVQPADPLELWESPPFEPTVRGDNLYARGASDDKGHVFATLKAVESLLATDGLPVNVKVLVEGEEESSGLEIARYVPRHRRRLRADCALVMDSGFVLPGVPSITVGLRGILYTEVEVRGPASDLHSGTFGGAAPNPFHEMVRLLASLRDRRGRIRIPGFYRPVREPSEAERASPPKPFGFAAPRQTATSADLAKTSVVELPEPESGATIARFEDDDEVDMIPLIDISMVLLVFFIMIQAAGALAPVDVPEMRFAGELTADPNAITITI